MTLPVERFRSIRHLREFAYSFFKPNALKRGVREIRKYARSALKHYPGDFDLERIAECPRCKKILERDK